jgi:dihydrofolate reductase
MHNAIAQTGAVLMGHRTFEIACPDSYVGNFEFQVPIFVLTHHPPKVVPKQDQRLTFTFVTDGLELAVAQAKADADKGGKSDKAVQVVGGVNVAQQLLDGRVADELHNDIMPIFLGAGVRAFESSTLSALRLEKIKLHEVGPGTSLRFRIKRLRASALLLS